MKHTGISSAEYHTNQTTTESFSRSENNQKLASEIIQLARDNFSELQENTYLITRYQKHMNNYQQYKDSEIGLNSLLYTLLLLQNHDISAGADIAQQLETYTKQASLQKQTQENINAIEYEIYKTTAYKEYKGNNTTPPEYEIRERRRQKKLLRKLFQGEKVYSVWRNEKGGIITREDITDKNRQNTINDILNTASDVHLNARYRVFQENEKKDKDNKKDLTKPDTWKDKTLGYLPRGRRTGVRERKQLAHLSKLYQNFLNANTSNTSNSSSISRYQIQTRKALADIAQLTQLGGGLKSLNDKRAIISYLRAQAKVNSVIQKEEETNKDISSARQNLFTLLEDSNYDSSIDALDVLPEKMIATNLDLAMTTLEREFFEESNLENNANNETKAQLYASGKIATHIAELLLQSPLLEDEQKTNLTNKKDAVSFQNLSNIDSQETNITTLLDTLNDLFLENPALLIWMHQQMEEIYLVHLHDFFVYGLSSSINKQIEANKTPTEIPQLEEIVTDEQGNIDINSLNENKKQQLLDALDEAIYETAKKHSKEEKVLSERIHNENTDKNKKRERTKGLLSSYLLFCKEEWKPFPQGMKLVGPSVVFTKGIQRGKGKDLFSKIFQQAQVSVGGTTMLKSGQKPTAGIFALSFGGSQSTKKGGVTFLYQVGADVQGIGGIGAGKVLFGTNLFATVGARFNIRGHEIVGGSGKSKQHIFIGASARWSRKRGGSPALFVGAGRSRDKLAGVYASTLDTENPKSMRNILNTQLNTLLQGNKELTSTDIFNTLTSGFDEKSKKGVSWILVQQNLWHIAETTLSYLEQARKDITKNKEDKDKNKIAQALSAELASLLTENILDMCLQTIAGNKKRWQTLYVSGASAGVALHPAGITPIGGINISWFKKDSLRYEESLQGLANQLDMLETEKYLNHIDGGIGTAYAKYNSYLETLGISEKIQLYGETTNTDGTTNIQPITTPTDGEKTRALIPNQLLDQITVVSSDPIYKRYLSKYDNGVLVPANMSSSLSLFPTTTGTRVVLVIGERKTHRDGVDILDNAETSKNIINTETLDELGGKKDNGTNENPGETYQKRQDDVEKVASLPLTKVQRGKSLKKYITNLDKENDIFDDNSIKIDLTDLGTKETTNLPTGTLKITLQKNNTLNIPTENEAIDGVSYNSRTKEITLPVRHGNFVFTEKEKGEWKLEEKDISSSNTQANIHEGFSVTIVSFRERQQQLSDASSEIVNPKLPTEFMTFLDSNTASDFFLWMRYGDSNYSDGRNWIKKADSYDDFVDIFDDGLNLNEQSKSAKKLVKAVKTYLDEHKNIQATDFGLKTNSDNTLDFSKWGFEVSYDSNGNITNAKIQEGTDRNLPTGIAILHQVHGELSRTWMTEWKHLDKAEAKTKAKKLLDTLGVKKGDDLYEIAMEIIDSDNPVKTFEDRKQELEKALSKVAKKYGYERRNAIRYGSNKYNYDLLNTGDQQLQALRSLKRLLAPDYMVMKTRESSYKARRTRTPWLKDHVQIDNKVWEKVEEQTKEAQAMFAPKTNESSATGERKAGTMGLVTTYKGSRGSGHLDTKLVYHPTIVPGSFVNVATVLDNNNLKAYKEHYLDELFSKDPQIAKQLVTQIKKQKTKLVNAGNIFPEGNNIDNLDKNKLKDFLLNKNFIDFTLLAGLFGPCKNRLLSHKISLKYKKKNESTIDCTPVDAPENVSSGQGGVRIAGNPAYRSVEQKTTSLGFALTKCVGGIEQKPSGGETEPGTGENIDIIQVDESQLDGVSFHPEGGVMVSDPTTITINGNDLFGHFQIDNVTGEIVFVSSGGITSGGSSQTISLISASNVQGMQRALEMQTRTNELQHFFLSLDEQYLQSIKEKLESGERVLKYKQVNGTYAFRLEKKEETNNSK